MREKWGKLEKGINRVCELVRERIASKRKRKEEEVGKEKKKI